ncbi:MAG: hypothetical protein FWG39_02870, partial [Alphaproteobacteria bacterium]|nr:hypothetical protein [Alphaproteobacteria bacterium]
RRSNPDYKERPQKRAHSICWIAASRLPVFHTGLALLAMTGWRLLSVMVYWAKEVNHENSIL